MRAKKVRMGQFATLVLISTLAGGCLDAFVEGLSRGLADGVAVVVEDFVTQLPTLDAGE